MKLHKQIETLFHLGTAAGLSDGRLVGQFVAMRGTGAEAEAALRGPCRPPWGDGPARVPASVRQLTHDAEDAAQATFLVLARRGLDQQTRVSRKLAARRRASGRSQGPPGR